MQKGPLQVFFWLLAEVSRTILKKHQSKIIHLETKNKSNNMGLFKRKISLSGSKSKVIFTRELPQETRFSNWAGQYVHVYLICIWSQNIPNIWPTQKILWAQISTLIVGFLKIYIAGYNRMLLHSYQNEHLWLSIKKFHIIWKYKMQRKLKFIKKTASYISMLLEIKNLLAG